MANRRADLVVVLLLKYVTDIDEGEGGWGFWVSIEHAEFSVAISTTAEFLHFLT